MKRLIAFFTSNWGLKILAFILALVVFYSMKETSKGASQATTRNAGPSTFNLKGPVDGGK